MAFVYRVSIAVGDRHACPVVKNEEKQDSYKITWFDRESSTEESFFSSANELKLSQDELTHLWYEPKYMVSIGEKLFRFLDGDRRFLELALAKAKENNEKVLLQLCTCKETEDWPFEILAKDKEFLIKDDLHLVRCVSDRGRVKNPDPENRSLKLLFMASSAKDVDPVLSFEKEEDAMVKATEKLAVDIEVEDSGSLKGLGDKLLQNSYDVVHLSGHAGIDKNGDPFFVMEDETGYIDYVYPDSLWKEALKNNAPKLLFLSGCSTGETQTMVSTSYARRLVECGQIPSILGWGRSVSDTQAAYAAEIFYRDISRGKTILDALQNTRYDMMTHFEEWDQPDWPLLRLFGSEMMMNALVKEGQKVTPKHRQMKHISLKNSQVKILEEGFVGRRHPLQTCLKALLKDKDKVGVLLHGAGGLGKSCLAGKLCERLPEHNLIVVHGKFNAVSFEKALRDAFLVSRDELGKQILASAKEMRDIVAECCVSCFKEKNYLVVLDDFEQNQEGYDKGNPGPLTMEASVLLHTLLYYLPFSLNMTQLIITGRYEFKVSEGEKDLVKERLELVCLTSFSETEQKKKVQELKHLAGYKGTNASDVKQLVSMGRGNPRLMEWIDVLVGEMEEAELPDLIEAVKGRQEEFIRDHVLRELIERGGEEVGLFLKRFSIFRLPVKKEGAKNTGVSAGLNRWEECLRRAKELSIVEYDHARETFMVTPMLREEKEKELLPEEALAAHRAAFDYYTEVCESMEDKNIDPVLYEEWVYHALGSGEEEKATDKGGDLVNVLRDRLAFLESRRVGEWILSKKKQALSTENDAYLLNELAYTIDDMGDHKEAIRYYERALAIFKKVYGENHQNVATALDNLGLAWDAVGEKEKAIGYHEQALSIFKKVYGENHPDVATALNNLGFGYNASGEPKKAISYYEQALAIDEAVFGKEHPNVARDLNNLGAAYKALGETKKAIGYYERALAIDEKILGKEHPKAAIRLHNLGAAYFKLGDIKQAKPYLERAYAIRLKFLGPDHHLTKETAGWLGACEKAEKKK